MNPDPKQLLQIIHNRGEQCWINPVSVEQARAAAQQLAQWIDAATSAIEKANQLTDQTNKQAQNEKK